MLSRSSKGTLEAALPVVLLGHALWCSQAPQACGGSSGEQAVMLTGPQILLPGTMTAAVKVLLYKMFDSMPRPMKRGVGPALNDVNGMAPTAASTHAKAVRPLVTVRDKLTCTTAALRVSAHAVFKKGMLFKLPGTDAGQQC